MKKLAASLRRIGLVANPEKASRCAPLVRKAGEVLVSQGRVVTCDPGTAALVKGRLPSAPSLDHLARNSDLLLVFGGDGTMLKVAREVAGLRVPLLGINAGHLGFLTAVQADHLVPELNKLPDGRFLIEERALLEATITRGKDSIQQMALNDFVLSRGSASRLIELEVQVNGELLTRYRCDGFIASSPTGSTAYSLAAGGAIVSPDAEVFVLTPICPHTLSIRPLIVNLDSTIRVTLLSQRLVASLAADGQETMELTQGDTVTIRRSSRGLHMLRLEGTSFFSTLRQKFGWSGGND